MSALKGLIAVMIMQLVATLKEVTPALVTLGTQVMVFIAQVSATITAIPVLTRNYAPPPPFLLVRFGYKYGGWGLIIEYG